MKSSGTRGLAVEPRHALRVAALPAHHRDPFDRLIIAQAQLERMTVLTVDPQFAEYQVKLLAA